MRQTGRWSIRLSCLEAEVAERLEAEVAERLEAEVAERLEVEAEVAGSLDSHRRLDSHLPTGKTSGSAAAVAIADGLAVLQASSETVEVRARRR